MERLSELSPLQGFLFLGGVLILIFTLFRIGRRRWTRNRTGGIQNLAPEAHPPPTRARPPRAVTPVDSGEVGDLVLQLEEVGREIEAKLDTRIRHARRLVDEMERLAERLENAARGNGVKTPDTTESEPTPVPREKDPVVADPDRKQIMERVAAGKGALEIAGELERPVGEVELIIALDRQANPAKKP
jgi:hypothetical protein